MLPEMARTAKMKKTSNTAERRYISHFGFAMYIILYISFHNFKFNRPRDTLAMGSVSPLPLCNCDTLAMGSISPLPLCNHNNR